MVGGLPGKAFVFIKFEEGGGGGEIGMLALAAIGLDRAELVEEIEVCDEAMGVDDVKVDTRLPGGRVGRTFF